MTGHAYWGENRHHACPLDAGHDGPCTCRYCTKTEEQADGSAS